MRIDAHIHFWKPSCGFDNRPIADHEAYRRDFLPHTVAAELDAARIDGVILVQAAPQAEETGWLLELARDDPRIVGVTGWADLDSPSCDFGPLLANPKIVGIRAQLRREADAAFVTRRNVVRSLSVALRAGLNVTILAEHRHHAHVAAVLERLPRGPLTLNHLGLPFAGVSRDEWRAHMRRYAERPDLFVQLSGLPFLFGERWRDADAHAVLDDVLDIFGPRRLLFAGDWPMMVRFATYGDWVHAIEAFLDARGLRTPERDAIFAGNALRAYPRLRRAHAAEPDARAPAGTGATGSRNA